MNKNSEIANLVICATLLVLAVAITYYMWPCDNAKWPIITYLVLIGLCCIGHIVDLVRQETVTDMVFKGMMLNEAIVVLVLVLLVALFHFGLAVNFAYQGFVCQQVPSFLPWLFVFLLVASVIHASLQGYSAGKAYTETVEKTQKFKTNTDVPIIDVPFGSSVLTKAT
jgi:hypothetical protein